MSYNIKLKTAIPKTNSFPVNGKRLTVIYYVYISHYVYYRYERFTRVNIIVTELGLEL